MKSAVAILLFLLISALGASVVLAADINEKRVEADQYYSSGELKKASKLYQKMAKTGDHYSQGKLASMAAKGEGQSADLEEAYAWAVLAEEGGVSFVSETSKSILARTTNKAAAKKQAKKLQSRYGQQALVVKAQRKAEAEAARRSGSSMGSNLSR